MKIPQTLNLNLGVAVETDNPESRTITGVATILGTAANASTGTVVFEPDSLQFPPDLKRVKLLLDHDPLKVVGYATSVNVETDKVTMSFYLPEGPAGDEALASAKAGLRDGLSIGTDITRGGATWNHETDVLHVNNAMVREVSLTAIPAFDAARVEKIAAQAHTHTERNTMETNETTEVTASNPPANPAPVITTPRQNINTVTAAARLAAEMMRNGEPTARIAAALNDITPANSDEGKGFLGRGEWLGELWKARRTDRPLIDSLTRKDLPHATKVEGFEWVKRPTVGTYAGNKTEIPSSDVQTKAVTADVERIAGGWDIDRIYADLGNYQMIEALWEGALEDYQVKTEAAVVAKLKQRATQIHQGEITLLDALIKIGVKASTVGARLDFVAFGADQWEQFINLKKDEVPFWLGGSDRVNISNTTANVNGLNLFLDPTLGAKEILAGDKRCATYYEKTPPVRVNAVDLPRGGIDLGLFGYHALIVNDANAVFKVVAG